MICTKCKLEFQEELTICPDCGSDLIENEEEIPEKEYSKNWLNSFGEITAQKAIIWLFYLGILPLFFSSIIFGKYIYLGNKYFKDISYMQNGVNRQSLIEVNNLPLGLFLGFVYLIVGILLWKILCELLIIIFRCFETYIEKNKQ